MSKAPKSACCGAPIFVVRSLDEWTEVVGVDADGSALEDDDPTYSKTGNKWLECSICGADVDEDLSDLVGAGR